MYFIYFNVGFNATAQVPTPVQRKSGQWFQSPMQSLPGAPDPLCWENIGAYDAVGVAGAMWEEKRKGPVAVGKEKMQRRWNQAVLQQQKKALDMRAEAALGPGGIDPGPVQTLTVQRGRCSIRTYGVFYGHREEADLRIDLTQGVTNLTSGPRGWSNTEEESLDGTDERLQEELMVLPCYQKFLRNVEQVLKPGLLENQHLRVAVESTMGRHRSVAFACLLQNRLQQYTQVEVEHLTLYRWQKPQGVRPNVQHWRVPEFRRMYLKIASER